MKMKMIVEHDTSVGQKKNAIYPGFSINFRKYLKLLLSGILPKNRVTSYNITEWRHPELEHRNRSTLPPSCSFDSQEIAVEAGRACGAWNHSGSWLQNQRWITYIQIDSARSSAGDFISRRSLKKLSTQRENKRIGGSMNSLYVGIGWG